MTLEIFNVDLWHTAFSNKSDEYKKTKIKKGKPEETWQLLNLSMTVTKPEEGKWHVNDDEHKRV